MGARLPGTPSDRRRTLIEEGEYGERINWKAKIKWDDEQNEETLAELFLPETERFYRRKEIDTRKLNFEYYWIDLKAAAQRENREQGMRDRSVFIKKDVINVYPDTLAWIHDYAYSYHEPLTKMYSGIRVRRRLSCGWRQLEAGIAFCIWRTQLLNSYLADEGELSCRTTVSPPNRNGKRAARQSFSPYPWGGPYIRNSRGCFWVTSSRCAVPIRTTAVCTL